MALTAAAAPVSVVMHGTSCIIAARRTARSSKNDSRPSGVLTIRSTLRLTISSAMFGRPFVHLEDDVDVEAVRAQVGGRAARGDQLEPELREIAGDRHQVRLVVVVDADERRAALRQPLTDRQLRLGERDAEAARPAHHFAGRLHLRPENRVDAREADERKHRALDEHARRLRGRSSARARRACVRPSPSPRPSPATRRSPSTDTARCATRADSPRARTPHRLWWRTGRSSGRRPSARARCAACSRESCRGAVRGR